jgi:hypothetical protein
MPVFFTDPRAHPSALNSVIWSEKCSVHCLVPRALRVCPLSDLRPVTDALRHAHSNQCPVLCAQCL